mmetsp:Transcript_16637/g.20741  ORF Transcript_16637/g.20741 Transcript_16637/m.20741 type:complete len:83 (+) Transcript_16637:169-417(+)
MRVCTLLVSRRLGHGYGDSGGGDGGWCDKTNWLPKEEWRLLTVVACGVSVIDYDHVRLLGNMLEVIVREKGCIFEGVVQGYQ